MFDIQAFQKAIVQGNYFWKKHVLQRMIEREVKQNAVIETLLYGEIIDFLRKYIHAEKNTFSATNQVNSSNVAVLWNSIRASKFTQFSLENL